MLIDKNNEGAWRISETINEYLETQVYYFYTKKEAIKAFKDFKKQQTNKGA
jgi:ribosomal protein L10